MDLISNNSFYLDMTGTIESMPAPDDENQQTSSL